MVRPPSFDSSGMKRGAWNEEEDNILRAFVERFGHSNWRRLPLLAGLPRCGKSCRLRWMNYLKPGLKRGNFTEHEEDLIIKLHAQLGNKWSAIAAQFPGRTDNDIKNFWNAHIIKRRKRNGAVAGLIRAQTPPEEQSSPEIKAEHNFKNDFPRVLSSTENPENINTVSSVADSYSVAQARADLWTEPYQACISQSKIDLPPFPGEEIYDFGLWQGLRNDMSTLSDSSDGGIISWNPSTAESEGSFWSERVGEDTFDMVLW